MSVPTAAPALTRGDLRWRIANRLGGSEEWAWRCVAEPGATQNMASLADLVIGGMNESRGMWAYFPDGPNAGLERRVVAFRPWDTGDADAVPVIPETLPLIEWAPLLPAAVAPGERIDLSMLRPSRINDAIDDALRLLEEFVAITASVVVVTDGLTDSLPLPADAVAVADVSYLDDGVAGVLERAMLPRSEWSVQPGRTLRLASGQTWGPLGWSWGAPAAGTQMLIDYRAAVPLPTHDDDLVLCLPAAIVDTAVSELALGMPEHRQMLPLYLDQAQRSRSRAARHDFGSLRPVQP